MLVELSRETIDGLKNIKDLMDRMVALYEVAVPEFNPKINQTSSSGGFPKVNAATDRYIEETLFSKPKRVASMWWFNYGFTVDDSLPDWQVDNSAVVLEEKSGNAKERL
jgi:hypothetical protein